MHFYSAFSDAKGFCDALVAQAFGHQKENFFLALSQLICLLGPVALDYIFQKVIRYSRMERHPTDLNGLDSPQ